MKLKTVKKSSEINLKGISVEFIHEDSSLKEIILTDEGGGKVRFKSSNSYSDSIAALIPKPLDIEERYHVSGQVGELAPISEYFENEHDASSRKSEMETFFAGDVSDLITVEKVSVPVDDDGDAISAEEQQIPF